MASILVRPVHACLMTDWAKWDRIAASLSDDEEPPSRAPAARPVEPVEETLVGVGAPLAADGRVVVSKRPGNARGNALSTNAPPPRELPLTGYSWSDGGGTVSVRVPMRVAGEGRAGASLQADSVAATFAADAFDLRVRDDAGRMHRLHVSELPCGGLLPEECRHRVLGGEDAHVLLTLAKRRPDERWPALGAPAVRVARPLVTVRPRGASPPRLSAAQLTQYRWSDNKNAATVWVVVPGVHSLPAAAVAVRFRELSFDLTVSDLGGKDFQFAVTELPMEVAVNDCAYAVETDAVKLRLAKWAKTGWHALQVHR